MKFVKHSKTLAVLIITLLAFRFVVSSANAWDWPSSDDLDQLWKDITDKAEEEWNKAKDWGQEQYDQAQQQWDETKENAKEWWRDAEQWAETKGEEYWQQGKEWSEQTKEKVREFVNKFEQTAKQNFQQALEIAKKVGGPYKEEVYNILEQEARRQLCEKYSNPEKVGELERKRDLLTEVTIVTVKLMPIYDPEKGEICTFDKFARDLYNETFGIKGGDFSQDPVRCVMLMLLDSDYLMYAKIIQTSNGKWISIQEALDIEYKQETVKEAITHYNLAKEGYNQNNPVRIEKEIKSFSSQIASMNNNPEMNSFIFNPLLLLLIGLVACLPIVVIKWKRSKKAIQNQQ